MTFTKTILAAILAAMVSVQASSGFAQPSDLAPEEVETWRNSGIRGSSPARQSVRHTTLLQQGKTRAKLCTKFDTNFIFLLILVSRRCRLRYRRSQ
jgi:hypothetical protein